MSGLDERVGEEPWNVGVLLLPIKTPEEWTQHLKQLLCNATITLALMSPLSQQPAVGLPLQTQTTFHCASCSVCRSACVCFMVLPANSQTRDAPRYLTITLECSRVPLWVNSVPVWPIMFYTYVPLVAGRVHKVFWKNKSSCSDARIMWLLKK